MRMKLSRAGRVWLMSAVMALGVRGGAMGAESAAPTAMQSSAASAVEAIDQQIDELRAKLAEVHQQIEDLAALRNAARAAPAGERTTAPVQKPPQKPAPGLAPRPATSPGVGGGLYDSLTAEKDPRPASALRPGTSLFGDTIRVGGYGSFRFETNNIDLGPQVGDLPRLKRGFDSFDFRRFVVTLDAAPSDRLRFYAEVEMERLNEIEVERNAIPENRGRATRNRAGVRFIQEVEGTSGGELAIEQAWGQYDFNDKIGARMGVVLPPVGRFNLLHNDDYWDLPRRPLAARGGPALPVKSAWRELGAGVVGNIPWAQGFFDYQVYVVNGAQLDFAMEEVVALREGRNLLELEPELSFSSGAFNGTNTANALTWRTAFRPRLGHEFAVSGYHGEYTPDYLVQDGWVNTLAFDGKTTLGNFEIEGEYIFTNFGAMRDVLNDMGRQMVDAVAKTTSAETASLESEVEGEFKGPFTNRRNGFWMDFKYRLRPKWLNDSFLGRGFGDPELIPIVRLERVKFDDFLTGFDFAGGRITRLDTEDLAQVRMSLGLAYRPTPSVVFSAAWEHNRRTSGSELISPRPVGTDPLPDRSFDSLVVGTAFGF